MKNLRKKSEKKIRKVEETIQNLPVLPQTYTYVTIYEAAMQLHFQKEYETACKICDALLQEQMVRDYEEHIASIKEFKPAGELSIRRSDVEKVCVALQSLLKPWELGKAGRITLDYDPDLPNVKIHYYSES